MQIYMNFYICVRRMRAFLCLSVQGLNVCLIYAFRFSSLYETLNFRKKSLSSL
uniref:Uncharacterized protein n=1 Tax=Octopus bimaculoides TaxID=37653 RepID=A0A0L8FIS4_OCTBM